MGANFNDARKNGLSQHLEVQCFWSLTNLLTFGLRADFGKRVCASKCAPSGALKGVSGCDRPTLDTTVHPAGV